MSIYGKVFRMTSPEGYIEPFDLTEGDDFILLPYTPGNASALTAMASEFYFTADELATFCAAALEAVHTRNDEELPVALVDAAEEVGVSPIGVKVVLPLGYLETDAAWQQELAKLELPPTALQRLVRAAAAAGKYTLDGLTVMASHSHVWGRPFSL